MPTEYFLKWIRGCLWSYREAVGLRASPLKSLHPCFLIYEIGIELLYSIFLLLSVQVWNLIRWRNRELIYYDLFSMQMLVRTKDEKTKQNKKPQIIRYV